MQEGKASQRDSQAVPQAKVQAQRPITSAEPSASKPSQDVGWAHASTSQVARTVAVALLTAVVVLGALFLLSQSAGAISGYVTGNLAISVICGVTTFVVLLILGMPYAA